MPGRSPWLFFSCSLSLVMHQIVVVNSQPEDTNGQNGGKNNGTVGQQSDLNNSILYSTVYTLAIPYLNSADSN